MSSLTYLRESVGSIAKDACDQKQNITLNSAGKEVYKVSDFEQLRRFLFLGSEGGSYYISEKALTKVNLTSLERLLADEANHDVVIKMIEEYSHKAFKKDYLVYALARVCSYGNEELRKRAYALLPVVCVIPTNLFLFVDTYKRCSKEFNGSTGWNALHKQELRKWYVTKPRLTLAYQMTKYKNRNGWTQADLLKLIHIKPRDECDDEMLRYFVKDEVPSSPAKSEALLFLTEIEALKQSSDEKHVIAQVKKWKLAWEHVPNQFMKSAEVMNALATDMPMVALLRNLNRLTALDVFGLFPETLDTVITKLSFEKTIVHPLQFLIALKMYAQGHGDLGKLTWTPETRITEQLNKAFYASFKSVTPTGKRYLLAMDVSGSMTFSGVCGITCMTAAEVACAFAMVIHSGEPCCDIMGFAEKFRELPISHENTLQSNLDATRNLTFGRTDISLPMTWAKNNGKDYDVIIVLTDNETNCNEISPAEALREYRKHVGHACKLIVVAMCVNQFSVADPSDRDMLDCAGFDSSTPEVIREFVMNT
jgi:60 kDa SS-A/Ro ribonucleoprotein